MAMTADSSSDGRLERALSSLRGLAVGDALGSQFFVPVNYPLLKNRELPPGDWQWTDDTEMACSVVAVLAAGTAAWVYAKMMRRTGNNTQSSLIVAGICGVGAFVIMLYILSLIPAA